MDSATMTEKPETCFCGEPVTDRVLGLCRKHEQEYDRMLDERYRHREGRDEPECGVGNMNPTRRTTWD